MKKVLSALLSAVMVMTMTGCGQSAANSEAAVETKSASTEATTEGTTDAATGEKVTLNVWHQWSNDTNELKAIYDQAVTDYMAENPNVTINTETLDTEAYKTKISAEFAGDASGIDVFYYWGAGMARKLVNADKLLPLDAYVTDDVK